MGKTGKWLRKFLTGKKEKGKESKVSKKPQISDCNGDDNHTPATPISIAHPTTPKEKRRWSFRHSSVAAPDQRPDSNSGENMISSDYRGNSDSKKHTLAVAAATAAAADAAAAAAKAAAVVIHLTAAATSGRGGDVEEGAATKIQSVFRGYLARKALNALRGLVKLQALVRGHLVRKQASATLRRMQALVTAQARARAHRLQIADETKSITQRQFTPRKSTQDGKFRNFNKDSEENIKIVEMDIGNYKPVTKARNSYSNHTVVTPKKQEYHNISPSPSMITDMSARTYSNHFDEYSYASPQCYSAASKPVPFSYPRSECAESVMLCSEYPFYPSYMAKTESFKAKVRSHSAPKQRPMEILERQTSRRRPSLESRNFPKAVRMQTVPNYQFPWSVKLDRSAVSLKGSECGSTSTVLTNTNYCRSLVGFNVRGARY